MAHTLIDAEKEAVAREEARKDATITALEIDLASARRINENQQATILLLQEQLRRERSGRSGWGDR